MIFFQQIIWWIFASITNMWIALPMIAIGFSLNRGIIVLIFSVIISITVSIIICYIYNFPAMARSIEIQLLAWPFRFLSALFWEYISWGVKNIHIFGRK